MEQKGEGEQIIREHEEAGRTGPFIHSLIHSFMHLPGQVQQTQWLEPQHRRGLEGTLGHGA